LAGSDNKDMERSHAAINNKNIVISIRGLTKSFGSNHVLNGVDLDLFQGENLVVLGRSGMGKSVLIKIISGLLKPDSGTVNVLGKNIENIREKELQEVRIRLGFSFQNSALYDSMTVRKNLEFPLVRNRNKLTRQEINDAVETVLDAVGLSQTIDQMPAELSGGQRKRIGIARTLILNPEVMLYDEPTAGLDPITSIEINKLINEVQEKYKTSSIIITHDLTCAKTTGNRIAMLLDGKFERQGTFEEVFNTDDERVKPFFEYNFIQ
jgi:phospholipid/cholesterol/gamma-HCH transport system ATP-binding protein